MVRYETEQGNIPAQPPPAEPLPQLDLDPGKVGALAQRLSRLSHLERQNVMVQLHERLAEALLRQKKFLGPDGRLYIVNSAEEASTLAQKFINDAISAHDVQSTTPPQRLLPPAPSSLAESVARSAIEKPASTAIEKRPGTAIQKPASTAIEKRPSTAIEKRPSTAIEKRPSTAIEQPASTVIEQRPSTALEQPATTGIEQPASAAVEKPATTTIEKPSTAPSPEPPHSREAIPASQQAGSRESGGKPQPEQVGERESQTGRQIVQPSESPLLNESLAAQAAPELQSKLAKITAQVPGARLARLRPQKGLERLGGKIEEGKPPETISDYLAAQISVRSPQAKEALVAQLKRRFHVISIDDQFLEGREEKAGYPSTNVQVEMGNGLTAEVQIVPWEVQQITDRSHRFYTLGRDARDAGHLEAAERFFQRARQINNQALERFMRRNSIRRNGNQSKRSLT